MKIAALFLTLSTVLLVSCSSNQQAGGSRDEHGCLASAGYLWCTKTGQCERAWDIAKSQGLGNEGETFEDYCRHK